MPKDDQYSDEEAQRRFMATLKAAVNTPPKPVIRHHPRKAIQAARERTRQREPVASVARPARRRT
jgi:hypothetical protein